MLKLGVKWYANKKAWMNRLYSRSGALTLIKNL